MADEMNISGVVPGRPLRAPMAGGGRPAAKGGASFKETLAGSLEDVRNLQTVADDAIRGLVSGEVTDVTEAIVAVEKADLAFNTMMQIRNKIVAAYEEVMRMNV